jgi:hypothetical protein
MGLDHSCLGGRNLCREPHAWFVKNVSTCRCGGIAQDIQDQGKTAIQFTRPELPVSAMNPSYTVPALPSHPQGAAQSLPYRQYLTDLSTSLFSFVLPLLPTAEELATKEEVRGLIERLIKTIEPSSRLASFGSSCNSFGLRNSGESEVARRALVKRRENQCLRASLSSPRIRARESRSNIDAVVRWPRIVVLR